MCSWYLVTNSKRYRNFRPETVGQRKGYTAKERTRNCTTTTFIFIFKANTGYKAGEWNGDRSGFANVLGQTKPSVSYFKLKTPKHHSRLLEIQRRKSSVIGGITQKFVHDVNFLKKGSSFRWLISAKEKILFSAKRLTDVSETNVIHSES